MSKVPSGGRHGNRPILGLCPVGWLSAQNHADGPENARKSDISVLLAQDSELQTKRRAAYPSISSTFLQNAFTLSWDYLPLAGLAGSGP
jgi:hypothetical protein